MRHLITVLALCAAAGNAHAVDFALGAQAGTPGLGLNATLGISKKVNVRGVFNLFEYRPEFIRRASRLAPDGRELSYLRRRFLKWQ